MKETTFDGDYPSEETLQALRDWKLTDASGALDFLAAAWHWPEFGCAHEVNTHEGYVLHAEPGDRFLRLATGGWSGNEELIMAFRSSGGAWARTWRLSAAGGLHIFRFPR